MKNLQEVGLWKANKGYVYSNGKLKYVEINSISTVPYTDHFSLKFVGTIGGKSFEKEWDGTTELPDMYETENDAFKNKISITYPFEYYDPKPIGGGWKSSLERCYFVLDGEVKQGNMMCAFPFEFYFTEGGCWSIKNNYKSYLNLDYLRAYEDVMVVESDGSTHFKKSISSKVKLTDEQMKLIEELEDMIKKCKDAKIAFVCADEIVHAFNTEECERYYIYTGDVNDDEIDFFAAGYTMKNYATFGYSYSDEYGFFPEFKSE